MCLNKFISVQLNVQISWLRTTILLDMDRIPLWLLNNIEIQMLLLLKKVHILLMVFFQQINHKDVTKFQMVCGIILYLFCFNKLHVIYEFIHMLSTAVKANERLYLYLSIYFGGGREEEWLVTLQNSRVSLLASYHKIIIQYLHYYSCSFTITCFHTSCTLILQKFLNVKP